MTDVIPSLLNLHVYDGYEPGTSQRLSFRHALEYENSFQIYCKLQSVQSGLSCKLLLFTNSVKAESVVYRAYTLT